MPLGSSFWLDETVTAFVVQRGAGDPSLQVAPQVAASLYYLLPRLVQHWFGFSEAAYRIPSLLAMALALFLIARLASRLIHPQAGWFAVFACLALRGFNDQAADARPYALGTCLACLSFWFLVRWLDSARWRDALFFLAAASLLWRVHLLFGPVYLAFGLYLIVRLARAESCVGWRAAAAVMALLGLSLIPVLLDALALQHQASTHVIVPRPSLLDLVHTLKLGFVAACAAAAALLSRGFRWPRPASRMAWTALSLILAWWLCHPLALYTYSWISGNSVFVSRYLSVALPGAALAVTAAAAPFLPAQRWKSSSALLGLGVLLCLGGWNRLWPTHHNSDWHGAAQALSRSTFRPDMPVICPSPFIEARPPAWRPDAPLPSFLYAHLFVYRITGRIYPFPFGTSAEIERYAADLTRGTLAASGRFAVYGASGDVHFWRNWLAARPVLASWCVRRLGPFGDVDAVLFEKDFSVAPAPVPTYTVSETR
jgi:mannosyltransferase